MLVGFAATGVGLRAQTVSQFASGFSAPSALAFDADGNLYVANCPSAPENAGTVSKIPSGGGTATTFASGLSGPYGLAFDTDGNLYVSSFSAGTVLKIPSGGGTAETFATGLNGPYGLAFDAAGNLYVANKYGNTVSKIPSEGGSGTPFASGITSPTALAFGADGYLYVSSGNTVRKVPSGGGSGTPFVTVPDYAPGTASSIDGLAFDTAGNLYLVSRKPGAVTKATSGGILSTVVSGLQFPAALARDAAGDLYVASDTTGIVSKITLPTPTITSLSPTSGAAAGGTSVVITGTNFTSVTAVKFGTTAAASYTVNSVTQITATSPGASAGTVHITVTTADGTSTTSAADQFTFLNAPPSVGNLDDDSVAFTEGDSALLVDAGGNATVTDPDSANFSGGNVTVSIVVSNVWGEDVLSIRHQGTGAGQIGVSGGNVSYAGVTIGTFTGGSNGNSLVVTLNANSTPTNVGALLRNLTYHNTNTAAPSTNARTVRVTVNDGAGGTSVAPVPEVRVALTAVNDTPTDIALSATTVNHSAGVNGVVGTLSATDADDTTFTFTLVAGAGDTANSSFNISGTSLRANNAAALAPGTYAVRVQADDGKAAGTYAESFTLTVVDNVAPAAPSTPNLAAASDSGTSDTDNLTTDTTPTFSGTAEAGSTVKLYQDVTEVGSAIATGGDWTITSTERGAGIHSFKATATDAAGNVSPLSTGLGVVIDTSAPIVSSVGVPANATYFTGQNLDFTVNWSDEVVAVYTAGGTPSIAVTVGGTTRQATYLSGDRSTALVFRYTVQSGDLDTNGITVGALGLNGGAITDRAGNNATLTLNSVGATAAVLVDAVAPTVTGRTVPADGTYKLGQNLDFTVTYSENVTVTGTPSVAVTLATGGTVNAAYAGGTGTATLTFRYQVAAGNLDADGIEVASSITLGGGTIKDAAGNNAAVTGLGFAATTGVLVDGVVPTVSTSNRQTPAGAATNGTSVVYRVTFSEAVTGVDTADFTLTKTGTANGTVASVSAVSDLVYDVTVNTLTGDGTLRLDLNNAGTGIADLATNAIATGYTAGQTYTLDHTLPVVSTVQRQTPATVHTDAASATWRVTFAEGVTGVDTADFTLTQVSGTGSGTIASVSAVNATVYDVVVDSLTGQGRLRLDLKNTGTGIADLTGNAIADGGFTGGDFYVVGVTSVFETLNLTLAANVTSSLTFTNKPAQRFTTAAGQPLTLSSVVAKLNVVTATPAPAVQIYTDNAGAPGTAVGTALTNPAGLTANGLNVWTGSVLLSASTTYWIVFEETVSAYAIDVSILTTGGTGNWLTNPDYLFRYGSNSGTTQTGAILLALGATSVPSITSTLTAGGTYRTAFSYTITATNTPTSFSATGLPAGLSLDPVTGIITGAATQTGPFNVTLTATNASGTGVPSTLVLTVAKAPLTVTANSTARAYGASNPGFTVSYTGLLGTDDAASLTTAPTATTTATVSSVPGNYAITAAGGVSANYTFSYVPGVLTVTTAAQTITFGALGDVVIGGTVALSATATSGLPVTFAVTGPATLAGGTLTTTGLGTVTVRATQLGDGNYDAAPAVERRFQVKVGPPPEVTTPTEVPAPPSGGEVTLTVVGGNASLAYQWQRNGENLTNATGPTLTLPDVQPPTAGLYTYTAVAPDGSRGTSEPVIVGVATTEKVEGTGEQVGADIQHPNGNVYDQLLLEGAGVSFTADAAQVTRISFVDLSGDIVQVEFSGAGSLSLVMDDASAPAPAANYNQPGVSYVQGHVGIVITGADETTNVSVISVGRINAVNQTLFRDEVDYDGVADIAFIAIQSANGRFGGVRTGNVSYFAAQGFTGVYAPGVEFTGPVYVGDIQAHDSAQPLLVLGSAGDVRITGGSLNQANGEPVQVSGITQLTFAAGQTSHGALLPAQTNQAVLQQDGEDVTDIIVPGP